MLIGLGLLVGGVHTPLVQSPLPVTRILFLPWRSSVTYPNSFSGKSMDAFDYGTLPLGHEEIRILELLPAASLDDPVRTRISKARILSQPSFSALSYAWGDGRHTTQIALGVYSLTITVSLDAALRALREVDESVFLWIDQVCINQSDAEEKTRQIPLMDKIYSFSDQTIGWLGRETTDSDRAMDYLQDVGSRAYLLGLSDLDEVELKALILEDADLNSGILIMDPTISQLRRSVQRLIATQVDLQELPALEGIAQLLMLPYFERGWIQQEIALPRKLMFKWGGRVLAAETFAAAIWFHHIWSMRSITALVPSAMENPSIRAFLERIAGQNARLSSHVIASLTMRNWYHSSKRATLTTASLLQRLRKTQFSQPQDRVYGILGIAADKKLLGLDVDTTRTWEEVFTDATRRIINACQPSSWRDGINFLSLVTSPEETDTLPSWVPNVNNLQQIATLGMETAALSQPYQACGQLVHAKSPDEAKDLEPRILRCHGVIIDRITELGPAWQIDDSGQHPHSMGLDPLSAVDKFATISEAIVTSNPSSKHPFRSYPQRLSEAKWRVPVLNRESEVTTGACRRATPRSEIGYNMAKYTMLFDRLHRDVYKILADIHLTPQEEAELKAMGLGDDDRKLAEVRLKFKKNIEYNKSPEHSTYCLLMDAFKVRRSFLGAEGYVGVGSMGMQAGDVVCVLYGGSFPFILREVDKDGELGAYMLVGQAYCDGIMDGEALDMGIVDQEFRLV